MVVVTLSERFAHRLVAWRWGLLGLGIVLAGLAWGPSRQVRFDRSIENMFAPDDPLLILYRKLKDEFGGNEIVMGVYEDPDLFAPDGKGIERVGEVSAELQRIGGVQEVLSLAEVNAALEEAESVGKIFGSAAGPPAIVSRKSRLASAFRNVFGAYTHDATGKIAVLVCMLDPKPENGITRQDTIDAIRKVFDRLPHGMIAGEPVMVTDGFRYVEQDGARLGWWTTLLLSVTILICFRSIRWVLIPVLVVHFALVLTRATMVWSHLQLSMVSSMLTAIVTVVGVATVIHVIVRFRQARGEGLDKYAAVTRAGTILAVPVFWACATDAVGFLSLTRAHVGPVQDFGIMTAVSCLWVLVGVLLLVPGLAVLGRWDADPHQAWGEGALGIGLNQVVRSVQRHPIPVSGIVMVLFAGALTGLSRLEVETDFTKNFRQDSPVVKSYTFIEKSLGGAGVWDVMIPAPAKLDKAYLQRVRALENRLRQLKRRGDEKKDSAEAAVAQAREENSSKSDAGDGKDSAKTRAAQMRQKNASKRRDEREQRALTKVISLVDGIDAASRRPLLARLPAELRVRGMENAMPHFVAALRTKHTDGRPNMLRIMLRSREQQSAAEKLRLIDEVTRAARAEFPPTEGRPGAEVTGFYVLLTNLIKSMLSDQWICFGVATLGIALMMLIAFRRIRLALVGLVPNVLPIIMVLGGMGWLGMKINMGAAMIAAVSMGLSVDSSIHYIIAYRRARLAGRGLAEALAEVQQTVGRPVVFSTLALVVGFASLCTSQFVPTIYFGSLVGLSMLGGLFGNLIVLPLLLGIVERAAE